MPKTAFIHPKNQLLWKVVRFPLTRIILAVFFVFTGVAVAQVVVGLLGARISANNPDISILAMIVALLVVYFSYQFYIRMIEQRPVYELSTERAVEELGFGILIGLSMITIVIGILWLINNYHASGINPWPVVIPALVANVPSGFVEEILFRGILFRISEEFLGTWIALAISALLFGLEHILSAQVFT